MSFFQDSFQDFIYKDLDRHTIHPEIKIQLQYALFPPGKYLRPMMIEALSRSLPFENSDDLFYLSSALEYHHCYSLIHDDLPCMDNALYRRGKLAFHHQFSSWQAVLAGDMLLQMSFANLAKIKNPNNPNLSKLFFWATGAKGLIQGQFLDLNNSLKTFRQALRMIELKTSRLFQIASVGSLLLSKNPNIKTYSTLKDFLALGRHIGVSFQLLDDLGDIEDLSEFNLFRSFPSESKQELKSSQEKTLRILRKYELKDLEKLLSSYKLLA